ncbi:MAG: cytochrome P450 [Gemmatirosa sp.]|nr:cytochrome P450 [Gemmatirosa sp.]
MPPSLDRATPLLRLRARWPGQFMVEMARDPLALFIRVGRLGDVVAIGAGGRTFVIVAHPELAREVLVTQQRRFVRGYAHRGLRFLLGDGLLTSEGDFHLRQRRLAQPAFHRERIARYAEAMTAAAARRSDAWDALVDRAASGAAPVVDVAAEMNALTLAIAGETLFGTTVGARARDVADALTDAMRAAPLAFLPVGHWALRLPIPAARRFRSARTRLDEIVYGIIAERRAGRAVADDRGDLLSMLLVATDPEETDGAPMSDVQLRDEVMTLFLAGHETTANALAWTWYLLARHPDVEARLHAELSTVLGDGPAARTPTIDDLPRLAYARMVVAESMRLFPPAYAVGRICAERCMLGGHVIEPGWGVVTSPWLAHHDARWWPDPERFLPERWAAPDPERPKFAYFPFGGGTRICIGEQFAWTETILVLATLARRWRMRVVPGQSVRPRARITLRQEPGVRVELHRRDPRPS